MERVQRSSLLLTASEVGPLAGISRSMVYKLLACGALPSVRMGRSVRVPEAALQAWIERNTTGGEGVA